MQEHVFSAGGSRRKELIFLIQGRSKTSKVRGFQKYRTQNTAQKMYCKDCSTRVQELGL